MKKYFLSRRVFLKKSAQTCTGLMVGLTYEPQSGLAAKVEISKELGIWIRISPDGTTTFIIPSSEILYIEGTGVYVWKPGPNKTFEVWNPGKHEIKITWSRVTGLPDVGEFTWTFSTY